MTHNNKHMDKAARFQKNNDEWRKILTPEEYRILRERGTEPPFSGAYVHEHKSGTYVCRACKTPLFTSNTKFDSQTGWPSFFDVLDSGSITIVRDMRDGMDRVEVQCATCGGHLGHLFDDGPTPTGKRYCINSTSLYLLPDTEENA